MNHPPPLDLLTNIPGISWPAIPAKGPAMVLAVLYQLELSQWSSPDVLQQQQLQQLAGLVEHAYRLAPFYRRRFDSLGFKPCEQLTEDQWARIPILRRQDVQEAGDELNSSTPPAGHGPTQVSVTSGSTGRPVSVLKTQAAGFFWRIFTVREHLWHQRDFSQKLGVIRVIKQKDLPESGVQTRNWGSATAGLFRTGLACALNIHRPIKDQAEWLMQHQPGYLLSYPSNILALTRYFAERQWKLSGLKEVRTFGELLDPAVRKACRDVWAVDVKDVYSSQEVGYVALQCPECDAYHVQSEGVRVEILDPDDRPCEPGEVGRVIVTPLHNFATPLIRYEIGDFAQVGQPCACGRGLPVLKRIIGRQRNMLILPDGRRIWPSVADAELLEKLVPDMPPIQQFQYIQRSMTELELKMVVPQRLTEAQERGLRQYVQKIFFHPFNVILTYTEAIPCGPTGKYEDFRCEVEDVV